MKRCSYCGRDSDDAATSCLECGTEQFVQPPETLGPGTSPSTVPTAVKWFRLYAGFWCLFGAVVLALGVFLMVRDHAILGPEWRNISSVLAGGLIFGMHAIALFSPRKRWLWAYSLVVIALGVGSCFMPICIPMLVYWVKQDTKQYFG